MVQIGCHRIDFQVQELKKDKDLVAPMKDNSTLEHLPGPYIPLLRL